MKKCQMFVKRLYSFKINDIVSDCATIKKEKSIVKVGNNLAIRLFKIKIESFTLVKKVVIAYSIPKHYILYALFI